MTDQISVAARRRSLRERRRWRPGAVIGLGVLAITGCGPYQKAKLDREVDRLCAIDGGVHIYETVKLPKENFGSDGEVFPQFRHLPVEQGRYGSRYFVSLERRYLVEGNPQLVRSRLQYVRRSDMKVLAEQINYARGGGDLPGPWHPTTHQCKQIVKARISDRDVFVMEE
jgi:hypothetical protein